MITAYVVGNPVDKSLSPKIFSYLSNKLNQKISYKAFCTDQFSNFLKEKKEEKNFIGCNITFPLKEEAYKISGEVSEVVKILNSANVMKVQNSKLYFENTDELGFELSLQKRPERVLLLGFGCTTRSILFSLCKMKIPRVDIQSRKTPDLSLFQKLFPHTIMSSNISSNYDLVVNTTPAMAELSSSFLDFSVDWNAHIYDVNYWGNFLSHEKWKNHSSFQDGLSMLIYQALRTWEIWFEESLNKKLLHDELYIYLRSL